MSVGYKLKQTSAEVQAAIDKIIALQPGSLDDIGIYIHDSSYWTEHNDFVPEQGALVAYSDTAKFKMGDGVTAVANLDFVDADLQNAVKFTAQILTAEQKAQARENIGAGTYSKPNNGIPSTDLAEGVIPDVSDFITKSVNDLTYYYLKSETYTKDEVAALIGAIQQFHYEIYASTSAVTSPASNVLYLIGPTGSGADKYEEYIYSNGWVKIGDTSIDLSGYVTTEALNTALSDYVTSTTLSTALSGKQDKIDSTHKLDYSLIDNTPTIPTVPDISTDISEDATSDTKTASPKAVKTYVDNHVPSVPVEDVTVGGTSVVTNKVAVIDLSGKQDKIDSSHKLDYSLLDNTPTIPSNLADLSDVSNTSPTDGQALIWDNANSTWKPGAAGTPDAVKYVSQSLTSEQQAQARTNIGAGTYSKPNDGIPSTDIAAGVIPDITGKQDTLVGSGTGQNIKTVNDQSLLGTGNIDAKDIFWATYDSTTSAQIEAAYQAGKMVCVFWSNRVYTLIYRSSSTAHTFGYVWGSTTYRVVCTSNVWTNTSVALQKTEDIVSSLTGNETSTTKYPNTKAVYDAIAALPKPMVFKGTIGTGGTSTTVPSSPTEGDTYKIISGGESLTFTGISDTIKVGDTVIYKNSTTGWVLIPSGDEPSGTVTTVTAGAGLNTTGADSGTDGGSITSSGSINLTKSGVTAGTYQGLTVDKYGRVTAASDQGYYKKPSSGIPATDIESGVIPSVPVTDVTVGGTSVLSNGTAAVPAIHNVPSGGSQGQVLGKSSSTDYAVEWVNQSGGTEVEANPTVPSGTTPTSLTGLKVGSDYYSVSGGGGGTTVEANPTVPSGTTPTDVKGLKIGNAYYDICAVHLDITNNDIDSAINTAWV